MRNEVLEWRKRNGLPWHSPAHGQMGFSDKYLVTAACFEHKRHIGISPDRMNCCEKTLLDFCLEFGSEVLLFFGSHFYPLIMFIITRFIINMLRAGCWPWYAAIILRKWGERQNPVLFSPEGGPRASMRGTHAKNSIHTQQ